MTLEEADGSEREALETEEGLSAEGPCPVGQHPPGMYHHTPESALGAQKRVTFSYNLMFPGG